MTTATATPHKCKHGCGKETAHRGAMNLHERFHCPTLRAAARALCECEDGGSWELLSPNVGAQRMAIASGYKKYCTECGEVI